MKDELDLSQAVILNAPDVRSWPATADITRVIVAPDNVSFEFTKQDGADRWPDQPFGDEGGSLQYTVWLFLRVNDVWYCSAFIEMWFGRDGVGDGISDFVKNWYYDAGRWAPMTGHAIAPGETIGFMLTAGDARNNAASSVHERSNIVTIEAPPADGTTRAFSFDDAPAAPTPPPAPTPAEPPPSSSSPAPTPAPATPPILTPEEGDAVAAAIDRFSSALENLVDGLKAVCDRLDRLETNGVKVSM